MALAIGRLAERLTLQAPTEPTDAQGGRSVVWSDVDTLWGALEPLSAGERIRAEAIGSQGLLRFRIRARADLTPAMRVSWAPTWPPGASARTLNIAGIVAIEDGRTWMHLECGELT